jgi:hypothetical protein
MVKKGPNSGSANLTATHTKTVQGRTNLQATGAIPRNFNYGKKRRRKLEYMCVCLCGGWGGGWGTVPICTYRILVSSRKSDCLYDREACLHYLRPSEATRQYIFMLASFPGRDRETFSCPEQECFKILERILEACQTFPEEKLTIKNKRQSEDKKDWKEKT